MTNLSDITLSIASIGVPIALLAAAPASHAQDSLEIKNFIGSINWSNGSLSADVQKNPGDTKISGRMAVTIDGGQTDIDSSDCKSTYGRYDFNWFGKKKDGQFGGFKNMEDMPILKVTLPKNTKLIVSDSVIFTDGSPDIGSADLQLSYCGKVTLGDVDGLLALDSRRSADVSVGNTGQIVANLKGSGDLTGGDSEDVLIQSHGSADVELADLNSLESSNYGSGDLYTGDIAGEVELTSHGSGDITLGNVDGSLSYFGHGSGDLEVASVEGASLELSSLGSGDIEIKGGDVSDLSAKVRGSAEVDFSGEAQTAKLIASGSGDISIGSVSGELSMKSSGSGEIDIGNRN